MWKTIPNTNNLYECNKKGEIRRKKGIVSFGSQKRKVGGKKLSPKKKKNGYLEVSLQIFSRKSHYVHRLIASAWLGEIPAKMTVNHKDGNKENNNLSNLEIVTYSENSKHAYSLGLIKPKPMPGELHPRSKTNDKEVLKIRKDHAKHRSIVTLQKDYPHLSKGTLTKIVYKQTWTHI